jgi:hypothetical protein
MATRRVMHPDTKPRGLRMLVWCGLALIIAASTFARAATVAPSTYFFLVFSDPAAGQEAEYNRWYNDEHGPDVTSIPGFVSAQRFEYAEQQLREVALKKPKYLIIYKVITADPSAVRDEIVRRAKNGQTRMSPTITNVKMYTYREFRPEMMGAGGQPADAKAGALQTFYQIVFGDAVKGMDREFNDWYDKVHEPEMLSAPGFVRAERGIISEVQLGPTDVGLAQSKYLAIFEMRTSDLEAVFHAGKKGAEPIPAFDRSRTFGYTYKAIGPLMDGDKIRAERGATAAK